VTQDGETLMVTQYPTDVFERGHGHGIAICNAQRSTSNAELAAPNVERWVLDIGRLEAHSFSP